MVPKSMWMQRQQCPCGDWKCFITYNESDNTSKPSTSSSKPMICPYVGMVFNSDHDAFQYYRIFARNNGFSIRKERSRLTPNLGIHKRDFVCYRSGFASLQPTAEHQRDRKSMRCGCDANMFLSKELVEDGVFKWFVVQFSNVHNHELLEDDQVRLLPANRKIDEVAQERIVLLSKAGFPIHNIYKVLETKIGNQGGKLAFVEKDIRNFIQNRKKLVQESHDFTNDDKRGSDLAELIDACRTTKEGDMDFVYDVTMDGNDKVENVAWSYGDSIRAYNMFGDSVYFDTAHRSIAHNMIFGAWFGFDNHGKTILLGCTLLQDETSRSFQWALQTFVQFMKGRYPHTIITDLDLELGDAIGSALADTKHVISFGNIMNKLSCWFLQPLGVQYAEFRNEFDALKNVDSDEDFEFRWNHLVSRYGLSSDRHVALLFSIRTYWASPYTRGCFLAMMGSTAYSKSVEAFLNGIFRAQTT